MKFGGQFSQPPLWQYWCLQSHSARVQELCLLPWAALLLLDVEKIRSADSKVSPWALPHVEQFFSLCSERVFVNVACIPRALHQHNSLVMLMQCSGDKCNMYNPLSRHMQAEAQRRLHRNFAFELTSG